MDENNKIILIEEETSLEHEIECCPNPLQDVDFNLSSSSHSSSLLTLKHLFFFLWSKGDSKRILSFLFINTIYMFIEVIVGWADDSLALTSDAAHMFFDNIALCIGLYASYLATRKPDSIYTYGYGRYEVIGGFINALLLIFIVLDMIMEALIQLFSTSQVKTKYLLITSIGGFLINLIGLIFFHDFAHGHGHAHDHSHDDVHCNSHNYLPSNSHCHHSHDESDNDSDNEDRAKIKKKARSANLYALYLHVAADTLGSLGVIISSLCIELKGWYLADPIICLLISFIILVSVIPITKETVKQLLQRVPSNLEEEFKKQLLNILQMDSIAKIQSAHLWHLSSTEYIASVRILVDKGAEIPQIQKEIMELLKTKLNVTDVTIQINESGVCIHHASLNQNMKHRTPVVFLK